MVDDRPRSIRLAAWIDMALGALVIATILLAQTRLAAFWLVWPGLGLILWGGVQVWATRGAHLRGTKILAMLMAVLGVVVGASSFLIQDGGPFRLATLVLGALIVAVSFANAMIAPDEDRRRAFEPRRPDDEPRARAP